VSAALSYWALPATVGLPIPALVQPGGNWANKEVTGHVTKSRHAGIISSLRMAGLLGKSATALRTPMKKLENLDKMPKQHPQT
jgi:hypothetical protein